MSTSPTTKLCLCILCVSLFRNTLSTAVNSMTSSERPSPEPILKQGGVPSRAEGELEASNALKYRDLRVWRIPDALSRGIPGNAPRAFPAFFFFQIFFPEFLTESPSCTGGMASNCVEGHLMRHPGVPEHRKQGLREMDSNPFFIWGGTKWACLTQESATPKIPESWGP